MERLVYTKVTLCGGDRVIPTLQGTPLRVRDRATLCHGHLCHGTGIGTQAAGSLQPVLTCAPSVLWLWSRVPFCPCVNGRPRRRGRSWLRVQADLGFDRSSAPCHPANSPVSLWASRS